MYWVWVAALVMGLGIVTFVDVVSRQPEAEPVFATTEATESTAE